MRLSPTPSRLLLSLAVIANLLVPTQRARAADVIGPKAVSSPARPGLVFTSASLQFGKVAVGQRKVQTATITNAGDSAITLGQVTAQGRDFTVSGLDLPLTLASGESITFTSVFAPRSQGDSRGSISFFSAAAGVSNPILRSEMTGTGTDGNGLDVDPPLMDFGIVQVGSWASQGGTLNAEDTEITISSAISSSPDFTLNGVSFPLTIPPWGSHGFTVTFAPQAAGVVPAVLWFMNVSGTSPLAIEALIGVGVGAQGHEVELSWDPSTSQNVIGYNVYRGYISGGPYEKINAVLDASTVYIDTSVVDGATYYYVTTAVDSNGEESVYSNQAKAMIP